MTIITTVKNLVLPSGPRERSVAFGLARGVPALIDFDYDTAFFFGVYESELDPYVEKYVNPGTLVFDVGGHRGWDALLFAKRSKASVVTFEVNPDNISHMEQSFQLSEYDIAIDPRFVGSRDDDDSVTLDAAMDQYFVPDFVKMDIEGAEAQALLGAEQLITKHRPSWVIEVHGLDIEQECLAILTDFGYETTVIDHKKRLFKESRGDVHNRWIAAS